ncbi:MAG: hypothetical protein M0P31_18195 [Solirubrobacteraceae bacterium]|nr:hypothetical protein [Solirubrobacteraceae bacterium]
MQRSVSWLVVLFLSAPVLGCSSGSSGTTTGPPKRVEVESLRWGLMAVGDDGRSLELYVVAAKCPDAERPSVSARETERSIEIRVTQRLTTTDGIRCAAAIDGRRAIALDGPVDGRRVTGPMESQPFFNQARRWSGGRRTFPVPRLEGLSIADGRRVACAWGMRLVVDGTPRRGSRIVDQTPRAGRRIDITPERLGHGPCSGNVPSKASAIHVRAWAGPST